MSDSLRPHESQHARPPCPSPTPRVHPDSRASNQWWHPAISSSVVPFSSRLPSFPASGCFPKCQFTSGGQSTGVSASASVLSMNIQESFHLGWTGWTSLQSKGLSRVFSNTTVQKHSAFLIVQLLQCSAFFMIQISHPYMTDGKNIALTRWTIVDKVMSLLFTMLPRLVITFLSCLQSPSAVILEPRKIKSATDSTISPSTCYELIGPDAMILVDLC